MKLKRENTLYNTENNERIKLAYITWMNSLDKNKIVCANLDSMPGTSQKNLSRAISHLLNLMDMKAFGKKDGKQRYRLQRFVVIENHLRENISARNPNPHAHILIEASGLLSQDELIAAIKNQWLAMRESGRHGLIERYQPGVKLGKFRVIGDFENYLSNKGSDAFAFQLCHLANFL
jgi:hypothetical protein